MKNIQATLIQTSLFWQEPERNMAHFSRLIKRMDSTSRLIVLPEMFLTGFVVQPQQHAQAMDSAYIVALQQLSREKECVICGSLIIREGENYFNRFLWIRPDGGIEKYDKKHLFTFGGEDKNFLPGRENVIFTLEGIRFKPMICYDLRFPVWARNRYSQETGYAYDVLLYTANWPEPRRAVWKTLLKARAIENQCIVIGVNRIGNDGEGLHYAGDSRVIDARGKKIASAARGKKATISFMLDCNALHTFREKFPVGPDWDAFQTL